MKLRTLGSAIAAIAALTMSSTGSSAAAEEPGSRPPVDRLADLARQPRGEPARTHATDVAAASVIAAGAGSFSDAVGDSSCRADIVAVGVDYGVDNLALNMRTQCPFGWPSWQGAGADSVVVWFLDTNADGFDDFEVVFYYGSPGFFAEVTTGGGTTFVCDAVPGYEGTLYGVFVEPECLGRPDAIQVQAAIRYDYDWQTDVCDCDVDFAPDGAYSPPVGAPPLGNGPGAASPSAGLIDVFARGQDNGLWTRHGVNGTWGDWSTLGGIVTSTPGVVSKSDGTLDVFIRGQDNALWSRHFNGTAWEPWYTLGGILTTAAGVVSTSPGTLDVFVAGQDRALWRRHFDGSSWGSWSSLGGIVIAAPAAASSDPGTMSVFVRGQDSVLWTRSFSGGTLSNWSPVGGRLTSAPAANSSGSGVLEVYARGIDRSLMFWHFTGGSWPPPVSLGGIIESPPAAVSAADNTVDVFARGQDSALWTQHIEHGQPPNPWQGLGGIIL